MNYGRTIRIYLADGSPTGIRHAELVNWTGQAIVCPRARIGELAAWDESRRPGCTSFLATIRGSHIIKNNIPLLTSIQ